MGVAYRRLGIETLEALSGAGVFYGAAVTEAEAMTDERVFVVGGGNSAGQAAVHVARFAQHVTLLVRGPSLADSMSDYLSRELGNQANIDIPLPNRGGRRPRRHARLERLTCGTGTLVRPGPWRPRRCSCSSALRREQTGCRTRSPAAGGDIC